jgi:hypothetical protein
MSIVQLIIFAPLGGGKTVFHIQIGSTKLIFTDRWATLCNERRHATSSLI